MHLIAISFFILLSLPLSVDAQAIRIFLDKDKNMEEAHEDRHAEAEQCSKEKKQCKKGFLSVGALYTPDEGSIVHASVVNHNLFSMPQHFSLNGRISGRRQDFSILYSPRILGLHLDLKIFNRKIGYSAFSRQGIGGSIGLSRQIRKSLHASFAYQLEDIHTIVAGDVAHGPPIHSPWGQTNAGRVASLKAALSYNDFDRQGMGTTAHLRSSISSAALGSDYDFSKVSMGLTHRRALGPLTLILSGSVSSMSGDGSIPLSERLMWGGHQDVRGYSLNTGPDFGSNFKATGKGELMIPLWPRQKLYASLFYDVGTIREFDDMGRGQLALRQSVGAGLKWFSPIGLVGVSLVKPLDGQGSPVVLFSLGGSF